jgi:acyl dehydratase
MTAKDLSFDDIKVGDYAELHWAPAAADIAAFAALSGDANPLHTDRVYAQSHGFKDCVVHGFLVGAKVSALIGMLLPGRRTLLLEYELSHANPVFAGDHVTLRGEVRDRWPDLQLVELGIKAVKADAGKDKTVAQGKARCKILY